MSTQTKTVQDLIGRYHIQNSRKWNAFDRIQKLTAEADRIQREIVGVTSELDAATTERTHVLEMLKEQGVEEWQIPSGE